MATASQCRPVPAMAPTRTAETCCCRVATLPAAERLGGAFRQFSDGFESGTFANYSFTQGGANTTVDSGNPRNGKYAAKFTPSGGNTYIQTRIKGASSMMMRGYVYVTSMSTSLSLMSLCG